MALHAAQGFKLAAGLGLGAVIYRRKIVEMEDDPFPATRVLGSIRPVESLCNGRLQRQVDIAGEPLHRSIHGDAGIGGQRFCELPHLGPRKDFTGIRVEGLSPLIEGVHRYALDAPIGESLDLGPCLCNEKDSVHAAEPRAYPLAKGRADLAGLVRDLVSLVFDRILVPIDPIRRPVLDLDHPQTRRADGDDIDLCGLLPATGREGEIAEQDPLAIARGGDQTVLEVLYRLALADVCERAALERSDLHAALRRIQT